MLGSAGRRVPWVGNREWPSAKLCSGGGSGDRRTARTVFQQGGNGRLHLAECCRVRRSRQGQDDEGQGRGQHRAMAHQRAIAANVAGHRHARVIGHVRMSGHAGVTGHSGVIVTGVADVPGMVAGHRRHGDVASRPGVQHAGNRWRKQQQTQGDRGQPDDKPTLRALADQVISNWIEPWTQVQGIMPRSILNRRSAERGEMSQCRVRTPRFIQDKPGAPPLIVCLDGPHRPPSPNRHTAHLPFG